MQGHIMDQCNEYLQLPWPEGVCPLKNTCWESAQQADFFPDDLKSISGTEKLKKVLEEDPQGEDWR